MNEVKAIFPDIEDDLCKRLLEMNGGNAENTINYLLEQQEFKADQQPSIPPRAVAPPVAVEREQPETDEEMARRLQDEDFARQLQEEENLSLQRTANQAPSNEDNGLGIEELKKDFIEGSKFVAEKSVETGKFIAEKSVEYGSKAAVLANNLFQRAKSEYEKTTQAKSSSVAGTRVDIRDQLSEHDLLNTDEEPLEYKKASLNSTSLVNTEK